MKVAIFVLSSLLLAFSGFFFYGRNSKSETVSYTDVDNSAFKQCLTTKFNNFGESCSKRSNIFCKPGLYCLKGTCVMERKLGASCSLNTECSRSGFHSLRCVEGKCAVLRGPTDSCNTNAQCFGGSCVQGQCLNLSTKKQNKEHHKKYCSNYLNSIQAFKKCNNLRCGGSQTGYLFDLALNCPQVKCKKEIENVKSSAFDEFGVTFTEQGDVTTTQKPKDFISVADIATVSEIQNSQRILACSATSYINSTFGITGKTIDMRFTNLIDPSTFTVCSDINNVFTNASSLGIGATCSFVSGNLMTITLGTAPYVKQGHVLTLAANALRVNGCTGTDYLVASTIIKLNPKVQPPRPVIKASAKITAFDDLVVSASESVADGPLSYEWSLDTTQNYLKPLNLSQFLTMLPTNTATWTLSKSYLSNLTMDGEIRIVLKAIDYFGLSNTISHIAAFSLNKESPLCYINYPPGRIIASNLPFTLTAFSKVGSGSVSVTNLSVSLTFGGNTYYTSSYTFTAFQFTNGQSFDVVLQVSGQNAQFVEYGNCTQTVTLNVVAPAPVAVITGSSEASILSTQSLSVDASTSYDPSVAGGVNPFLAFSWSCCTVDPNDGTCSVSACLAVFTTLSAYTGNKFTKANPNTAGVYSFTVTATNGTLSSSASQTIKVIDASSFDGVITLTSSQNGYFTFTTTSPTPVWNATLLLGSFTYTTSSSGSSFTLFISRTSITVSGKLKISSSATTFIEFSVEKDVAPTAGGLRILDSNGNVVTTPLDSNTQYTAEAFGWTSDSTISYEISGDLVGSSPLSTSKTFSFKPLAVSSTTSTSLVVYASVVSKTFGDRIKTSISLTFSIATYSPPGGNYENAAQNLISQATASSDPAVQVQGLTGALTVLSLSSTTPGSPAKLTQLNSAASSFSSAMTNFVVTETNRIQVFSAVTTLLASPVEFTATVKSAAINIFKKMFSVTLPLTVSQSSGVVSGINNLLTRNIVSGDYSEDLSQADALEVKNIVKGLARSLAQGSSFSSPVSVTSSSVEIWIQRYSTGSMPTTTISALTDGSVKITTTNSLGISGVGIIDLHVYKYASNYFTYATIPTNENITSNPVSVSAYNGASDTSILVSGVTPFNIQLNDVRTGNTTVCHYINDASGVWASDGVTASVVVPTSYAVCQVNHLKGEYASFKQPDPSNPTPITPNTPSNDLLYLLFLLLLIPVAVIIVAVIIGAIAIFVFRQGGGGYKKATLNTGGSVGLEDLGI